MARHPCQLTRQTCAQRALLLPTVRSSAVGASSSARNGARVAVAYPDHAAKQVRAAHACLAQQLLTACLAQWQRDVLNSVKLACVSVGVGAASYSFCTQLRPGSVTVCPASFVGRLPS